jgi:3-oxoacid CoA-transferase B subunit
MGGAMDLVAGAKKVIVTMEHVAKGDAAKVVKQCSLPLTGKRCVDMLITDLCVMEMDPAKRRFVLTETAPGVTVDEIKKKTEAELIVSPNLKTVAV